MQPKEFLVIRRRGFYVNIIPNDPDIRQSWMENNLPRTDVKAQPNKYGLYPEKTLLCAMRDCLVSFTPATAQQAYDAPVYDHAVRFRCGLIRQGKDPAETQA